MKDLNMRLGLLFREIAMNKITEEAVLWTMWEEILKKKKTTTSGSKKRSSAYLCFCTRNRPLIRQENPALKFGDIAKILGERWRSLSEEDRRQYVSDPTPPIPPPSSPSSTDDRQKELEALRIGDLRKMCKDRDLAISRTREVMIQALLRHPSLATATVA